jgi:DNA polymerase elongation subunit (family B)
MGTLYALDIETCTNPGDGLNPTNPLTRITSVSVLYGPDDKDLSPTGAVIFDDKNESRLLRSLDAWMTDKDTEPGLIITYNGANFDIPFLLTRSDINDVALGISAKVHSARRGPYGVRKGHAGGYIVKWETKTTPHDHVDIWLPYIKIAKAAGIKAGLKVIAKHYGYTPIEVDRNEMASLSVAQRAAYNLSDVEVTYELAKRLPDLYSFSDTLLFEESLF